MTPSLVWKAFFAIHDLPIPPETSQTFRFDNPFLINYVAFHHYRSLGWVVKSGIKFCVDLLLYKKGPVFHHAEYVFHQLQLRAQLRKSTPSRFAIVVIPVYEDPEDKESSPYELQNVEPFTWSWLSTINRVNSQVKKVASTAIFILPVYKQFSLNRRSFSRISPFRRHEESLPTHSTLPNV